MLYLGMVATILSTFACGKLGESDHYYLIVRPAIRCYDAQHSAMMVSLRCRSSSALRHAFQGVALVALVLWGFGWPCIIAAIL